MQPIADPAQVVLESEPYRRLSYTWHTFTPEWAEAIGFSDELLTKVAGERRSKVTFDIEPLGQMVKLSVVHDDFDPGSTVAELVSEGWPRLLSDLKTLLETGETLPTSRRDAPHKRGYDPAGDGSAHAGGTGGAGELVLHGQAEARTRRDLASVAVVPLRSTGKSPAGLRITALSRSLLSASSSR